MEDYSRGEEYISDSSIKPHAKDNNPAPAIEPEFESIIIIGKETALQLYPLELGITCQQQWRQTVERGECIR